MTTNAYLSQYIVDNCKFADYVTLAEKANVSPRTAMRIIKKAGLWEDCVKPDRSKSSVTKSNEKKKDKVIESLCLAEEKSKKNVNDKVEILPADIDGPYKNIDVRILSPAEIASLMGEQALTEIVLYRAALQRSAEDPTAKQEAAIHQKLAQSALVALGRWSGMDRVQVEQTVKDKLTDEALRNMNLTELLNQGE